MGNSHPLTEGQTPTKVDQLQRAITRARRAGIRVRREWLAGQTGGGCEIAGTRWLFLDLSLPIQEQIGQVEDALRLWKDAANAHSAN